MLRTFNYSEVEKNLEKYTLVDVRSPSEFAESTITGAVNIALFSDEERAHVGTVYKQEGKAAAVRLGIGYVSKSLPGIYAAFEKLQQKQKKFLIFCARGGMRSESLGGLLLTVGFPVIKLEKGYKGYRQHIIEALPALINKADFITLYGKTGTGKTEILRELAKLECNVLDLEGYAGHRGSVFGLVGLGHQPSQKQFETRLYDALRDMKPGYIFTEGESRRIGSVYMPNELADRMAQGRKILIEADIETRKEITLREYVGGNFDKKGAIAALNALVRYIGKEKITEYTALIEAGSYGYVVEELMIKYYDVVYNNLKEGYEQSFINKSAEETAQKIVKSIL